MLIAFVSGKGSPGTTSTAVAAVLGWPRPGLLVEADPAGAGIGFGYGRGVEVGGRGLLGAHLALRHGDPADAIWGNVVALAEDRWLLPGIGEPRQAASVGYPALARALARLGVDVLIDAGRIPGPGRVDALLAASDRVLVVLRPTLAGVHAAHTAAGSVVSAVGGATGVVGSVIVGPGRPYPEPDVRVAMRDSAPVAGCVEWDPAAAGVISDGLPAPRRWVSSPLLRSTAKLARTLTAEQRELQDRSEQRPDPKASVERAVPAATEIITGQSVVQAPAASTPADPAGAMWSGRLR